MRQAGVAAPAAGLVFTSAGPAAAVERPADPVPGWDDSRPDWHRGGVDRRLLLALPFALVVVVTVLVAALLPGSVVTGTPTPYCNDILLTITTDESMRAAERELRADPRVRDLTVRTKQENYERFKEIFAKHPDMVERARVEAIPASVHVVEQVGVDARSLAGELEKYGRVVHTDLCERREVPR